MDAPGLRRLFLDTARSYGYELVMPPLLEHLESLLTGTGEALDLQTFKLVDQTSLMRWPAGTFSSAGSNRWFLMTSSVSGPSA